MPTLEINLHPHQIEIYNDPRRFKIIRAGRRFGKSRLASRAIIVKALETPGGMYFIIAPVVAQTGIIWREITKFLPKDLVAKQYIGDRRIILKNGATLWARSGDNPDTLRGEGLDGCILDEAAMLRKDVWTESIRPALADKMGWCWMISCVTKDTFILTDKGFLQMQDLPFTGEANIPIPYTQHVFGLNGLKASEFLWENKKSQVLAITIEGKYALTATPNHPVFAKKTKYRKEGEWINAEDLKVGQHIALQLNQQVFGNEDELSYQVPKGKRKSKNAITLPRVVTPDFAYLCGIILGDGYINDSYFTVVNPDIEIIDFLKSNPFGLCPSIQVGEKGLHRMTCGSYEFAAAFNQLGYEKVKSRHKKIPPRCLRWSKENLCALLSGLFDTDGHVYIKKDRSVIGFSSSSKEMIEQVRMLLLNLGIITQLSKIATKPTTKVPVESLEYQVIIADQTAVSRFINQIGFRVSRKQSQIAIPKEKVYGDRRRIYEKHDGYEIVWKRITDISEGEAETYDFHIPDGHSFFTNGMISHNTPKGKNWFYKEYMKGVSTDPKYADYAGFHYTSYDNPFLRRSEVDAMSEELPELAFKQEIMAEFIEGGGMVFQTFIQCIRDDILSEYVPGHLYCMGVDLGRKQDFNVIFVGDMESKQVVYFERFTDMEWTVVEQHIKQVYVDYGSPITYIDSTGKGEPVYERLLEAGVNCIGINLNVATKPMLVKGLKLAFDRRQIYIPDIPVVKEELEAYTFEVSRFGNVKYAAPDGFHDDTVIALALLNYGMNGANPSCFGMVGDDQDEDNIYAQIPDIVESWDDCVIDIGSDTAVIPELMR